jgi:GNAT superfamily N-acetyltransferase
VSRAWSTRRATAGDRAAALALLGRAHAGDATAAPSAAEWDWLFDRNPATGSQLEYMVADAGSRLAGQYATVPLRLQIAGAPAHGLLSLNTATDPDFQHQGIFTTLAESVYEDAAGRFALVFGFPNGRSAPGFFHRLGWQDLGAPPVLVRPLAAPGRPFPRRGVAFALGVAGPVLRAGDTFHRSKEHVERVDTFGGWADAVWATLGPALGTAVVRDTTYLRWRFDDAPREYRRWTVLGAQGDEPVGYAVSRLVPWRGTVLAYVVELMAPTRSAASALLGEVLADARTGGAVAACVVATRRSPHRGTLLARGFLPVPGALGENVSFGARILTQGVPECAVLQRDVWYLSVADFDWI